MDLQLDFWQKEFLQIVMPFQNTDVPVIEIFANVIKEKMLDFRAIRNLKLLFNKLKYV